jgi:hypothetical protein
MGPDWRAFPEIAEINRAVLGPLSPLAPARSTDLPARQAPTTGYVEPIIPACRENGQVDLARLGWFVTVLACLVAVLILLAEGYFGYASVTFAVAVSAGINLT